MEVAVVKVPPREASWISAEKSGSEEVRAEGSLATEEKARKNILKKR